MNKTSILLALDGSEEAHHAAQLALYLAEKTGADVVAQHVIDTTTAWALLGTHKAGLIGSGLYISAFEQLCQSLRELAGKLAQRYEDMSGAQRLKSECLIDEGNPFELIMQRVEKHDLLVMGHEPTATKYPHYTNQPFVRASLAGALANACPKPMMIVQGHFQPWKTLRVFSAVDSINLEFICACRALSSSLGLKMELAILNPDRYRQSEQLEEKVAAACKDFKDISIEIIDLDAENAVIGLWTKKPIEMDLMPISDALLLVPTRVVDGKRMTIFGSSPGSFLRHLTLPQVVLCPEELKAPRSQRQIAHSSATA